MKKSIISTALLCAGVGISANAIATDFTHLSSEFSPVLESKKLWITMGQDAVADLRAIGGKEFLAHSVANAASKKVAIAQLDEKMMNKLSRIMHENHNRCGGYIVHDSLQSAIIAQQQSIVDIPTVNSALSQSTVVENLVPNLAANNIVDTITYLASFTNRYHTTSHGTAASNGLRDRWANIVSGTSWASVAQVTHPSNVTNQKSVVVTLTGSEKPDEIVVVGGHLDSTVGSTGENTLAPGADDDASGIATLTEIMRVYVNAGVQPKRTVKFYAYAAEEVGLRGSGDIASDAASNNLDVKGVLQLDMTNYDGSVNDVTLMTDYTSSTQNAYIQNLLNTYFGSGSSLGHITHGTDSCGYGCSDHASWHNNGFPASMPFETRMSQYNPRIHTSGDTLANMDTTGAKALKFAKMGLAYVIEMAADTSTTPPPPPPGNELQNGVPATGLTAATGADVKYTFDVPAGATSITIETSGGTGDADLYVRAGSEPTDSSYDCRPYKSGNNESCAGTAGSINHIRIKAYSGFSGLTLSGNYTDGSGGGGGPTPISESQTIASLGSGAWSRHTQVIGSGYSSFNVAISGGSGDADLYVRRGAQATTSSYDCRPYKNGNNEDCSFTNPQADTWHIDVRGYSTSSNINLTWSAN